MTRLRFAAAWAWIAALALALPGCAQTARIQLLTSVLGPVPAADADDAPRPYRVVVATLQSHRYRPCAKSVEIVRRKLADTLASDRRFRVLEPFPAPPRPRSELEMNSVARLRDADLLVVLRVDHLTVCSSVHHVHRYWDASASGSAQLVSVADRSTLSSANKTVYLSTRVRYSSGEHARALIIDRLVDRLIEGLLVRPTPVLLDLADPEDGTQRPAIERAKRGDWHGARQLTKRRVDSSAHDDAPSLYNLGIAEAVLGRPEDASEHIRRAVDAAPGIDLYSHALERLERGENPWNVR